MKRNVLGTATGELILLALCMYCISQDFCFLLGKAVLCAIYIIALCLIFAVFCLFIMYHFVIHLCIGQKTLWPLLKPCTTLHRTGVR